MSEKFTSTIVRVKSELNPVTRTHVTCSACIFNDVSECTTVTEQLFDTRCYDVITGEKYYFEHSVEVN